MELRPYQREAGEAVVKSLRRFDETLLVLPTGCGKTVVFADLAKRLADVGWRTLILAHRDELIEQARDTIASVHGILPGREKAGDRATLDDPIVVGLSLIHI